MSGLTKNHLGIWWCISWTVTPAMPAPESFRRCQRYFLLNHWWADGRYCCKGKSIATVIQLSLRQYEMRHSWQQLANLALMVSFFLCNSVGFDLISEVMSLKDSFDIQLIVISFPVEFPMDYSTIRTVSPNISANKFFTINRLFPWLFADGTIISLSHSAVWCVI